MSATGRGERGGGGADYFPTPAWCVDWLLSAVDLSGGRWLEPSAGDGAIIRAVNARRSDVTWTAVEMRPEAAADLTRSIRTGTVETADFLGWRPDGAFAACLGNPPFLLAERFIGAALEMAPVVAFLLRLDFLGSQGRLRFWRRRPADVYVLSKRPSFTGDGGTESNEFAWFVWGQCGAGPGRVRVLGPPESGDLFNP